MSDNVTSPFINRAMTFVCIAVTGVVFLVLWVGPSDNHLHASCGTVTIHSHTRSISWNLNTTDIDQVNINYLFGHFTLGMLTLCISGCPQQGEMFYNWDGRSLYYEIQDIINAPGRYKVECHLPVKKEAELWMTDWMPVPLNLTI